VCSLGDDKIFNEPDDDEGRGQVVLSESTYNRGDSNIILYMSNMIYNILYNCIMLCYNIIIHMLDDDEESEAISSESKCNIEDSVIINILEPQSYTTEGRVIINMPDDDEKSQAISSESCSLASETPAPTMRDSLLPDDYQHSHLVPGHQQSSTGHQPAFKDRNELKEKNRPKYDRRLELFHNMNNNGIGLILTGCDPEYENFKICCYKSSLEMYVLLIQLGLENIAMISSIQNFTRGNIEISLAQQFTSKDATDMLESIKKKHSETPYDALFLIINGHNPVNGRFYVSKDCCISLSELKSLTEHFASCVTCILLKTRVRQRHVICFRGLRLIMQFTFSGRVARITVNHTQLNLAQAYLLRP